jgi:hypothetical protein
VQIRVLSVSIPVTTTCDERLLVSTPALPCLASPCLPECQLYMLMLLARCRPDPCPQFTDAQLYGTAFCPFPTAIVDDDEHLFAAVGGPHVCGC